MMAMGELLLGGGVGSVLATAVSAVLNRRKLGADTASVLSQAATNLVKPLSDRIKELEEQLDRVQAKATLLENDLDACRAQSRLKDHRIREQSAEILRLHQQGLPREGN